MPDFLNKPRVMDNVYVTVNMPTVGVRTFTEVRENKVSSPDEKHTMSDPDIYGNIITMRNNTNRREIEVTVTKDSDDDFFLDKCLENSKSLGTLTYVDSSGDNPYRASGEGVSIKQSAERTNNRDEVQVSYTINIAKWARKF